MPAIELFLYEIRDPLMGRWRRTRYRMTEQDALERFGSDARKVESSRELREVNFSLNSTSSFQRGPIGRASGGGG